MLLEPPAMDRVTFRDRLNVLRKEKGWSVARLASESGVPLGSVNSYVAAKAKTPSLRNLQKLAKALGVSLSVFDDCVIPDTNDTSDDSPTK